MHTFQGFSPNPIFYFVKIDSGFQQIHVLKVNEIDIRMFVKKIYDSGFKNCLIKGWKI